MLRHIAFHAHASKDTWRWLVVDNASVHKTTKALETAGELGIEMVFLPPNTTAETQPLDVTVNGTMKTRLDKYLMDHAAKIGGEIPRGQVLQYAIQSFAYASQGSTVDKGFKEAGIFPPGLPTTATSAHLKTGDQDPYLKLCGSLAHVRMGGVDRAGNLVRLTAREVKQYMEEGGTQTTMTIMAIEDATQGYTQPRMVRTGAKRRLSMGISQGTPLGYTSSEVLRIKRAQLDAPRVIPSLPPRGQDAGTPDEPPALNPWVTDTHPTDVAEQHRLRSANIRLQAPGLGLLAGIAAESLDLPSGST